MKALFVYGGDHGAPSAINMELHGTRRGCSRCRNGFQGLNHNEESLSSKNVDKTAFGS
jgi:hypothetical protein